MSTPKTDLIDESTEPAGATPEPAAIIRSPDAQSASDAAGHTVRALGIDPAEALMPMPSILEPAREKWRGVRSKSLPIKVVQSMARAARMLYRGVLDWSMGTAVPVLQSKPRREPEVR